MASAASNQKALSRVLHPWATKRLIVGVFRGTGKCAFCRWLVLQRNTPARLSFSWHVQEQGLHCDVCIYAIAAQWQSTIASDLTWFSKDNRVALACFSSL